MCGPMAIPVASLIITAVGTAMSVKGQMDAGKAASQQAAYQAAVARNNQTIADNAAADSRARGEVAVQQQELKARQLAGLQRSTLAANGVQVDTGSAADLIADTAATGKLDALTIRSNAEREALGFEAQGASYSAEAGLDILRGQNQSQAAGTAAFGSFLSGSASVADKWYRFNQTGAFGGGGVAGGSGASSGPQIA